MMANMQLKCLQFCVCILFSPITKGVHGQCSTPPINQAAYEGTQNMMLACGSPTKVSYVVKATSDELTNRKLTNYDDIITSGYTNLFGVNSTGLIIKKAQTTPIIAPISTSGLYVIYINGSSSPQYGAKLVVVRQGPNCTCNAFNATHIQLNVSILYADGTIHPIDAQMHWTSNGNFSKSDTPARTKFNGKEFTSSSVIIVNGYDPPTYQCNVTFSVPRNQQYAYVATNAPEFSASCTLPYCGYTTTTGPTATTLPITTTEPTTTTTPTTTTEPTTTTTPTTTTEPTTTTTPTTTTEPTTTTTPTTTTEPTTNTLPPTTTSMPSTTGCNCGQTTDCPPLDQNCSRASECRSVGTNLTDVYGECVVKAELYARCDNCCPGNFVCGVVVTLRNDSRWLIHDSQCYDNKCEMVVVDASCMSSDWKLLTDKKVAISGVGDYVQAGNNVQIGLDMTDCSESCERMMKLP